MQMLGEKILKNGSEDAHSSVGRTIAGGQQEVLVSQLEPLCRSGYVEHNSDTLEDSYVLTVTRQHW